MHSMIVTFSTCFQKLQMGHEQVVISHACIWAVVTPSRSTILGATPLAFNDPSWYDTSPRTATLEISKQYLAEARRSNLRLRSKG